MKATGIVRRIDDLGRVVIPKEIRRNLRIREGDPLEIFVDRDGEVILKKYSPIGELGDFAQEYAESLHETTGHITLITDRDAVVAVAGASKKQWLDQHISPFVERAIEGRRSRSPPAVATKKIPGPAALTFQSPAVIHRISDPGYRDEQPGRWNQLGKRPGSGQAMDIRSKALSQPQVHNLTNEQGLAAGIPSAGPSF